MSPQAMKKSTSETVQVVSRRETYVIGGEWDGSEGLTELVNQWLQICAEE